MPKEISPSFFTPAYAGRYLLPFIGQSDKFKRINLYKDEYRLVTMLRKNFIHMIVTYEWNK